MRPCLGDLSEYVTCKRGIQIEGVVFATKTFCVKLANGLAALTITALLTALNYIPNMPQSPGVVKGLFQAVTLLPALLAFLALLPMLFYRLNEFTLKEIRDQKKEAAPARS